ncbi:hypothetical protein LJB42_003352 [Komagataella kurtzmanii]|nr:hypothetical protein LJB42_003352 [Komagataella kurtzmanii]
MEGDDTVLSNLVQSQDDSAKVQTGEESQELESRAMSSSFRSLDLINQKLLAHAELCLESAHLLTRDAINNSTILSEYHNLVQAALHFLISITKSSGEPLSVIDKAQLFYKISVILQEETEEVDLAIQFLNKADALVSRDGLLEYMFQYESAICSLLAREGTQPKMISNFHDNCIRKFENTNSPLFIYYFKFLKAFNVTLLDKEDAYRALDTLTELSLAALQSGKPIATSPLLQLMITKTLNILLYRGRYKSFENLYQLLWEHVTPQDMPVQIHGVLLLHSLIFHTINQSDWTTIKSKMVLLKEFLKKDTAHWTQSFVVHIQETSSNVSVTISWASLSRFKLLIYFYSALAYLHRSADGNDRAIKLLKSCEMLISNEIAKLESKDSKVVLSFEQLQSQKMWLNYLSMATKIYQLYETFINANGVLNSKLPTDWLTESEDLPSPLKELREFIADYDAGKVSSQELVYYHRLLPKIYLILAFHFQAKGKLLRAKYFYDRILHLFSRKPHDLNDENFFEQPRAVSYAQMISGIGGIIYEPKEEQNQLYCIALLNYHKLNLYDVNKLKSDISGFSEEHSKDRDFSKKLARKKRMQMNVVQTQSQLDICLAKIINSLETQPHILLASRLISQLANLSRGSEVDAFSYEEPPEQDFYWSPILKTIAVFLKAESVSYSKEAGEEAFVKEKIELYKQCFSLGDRSSSLDPLVLTRIIQLKEQFPIYFSEQEIQQDKVTLSNLTSSSKRTHDADVDNAGLEHELEDIKPINNTPSKRARNE